MSPLFKKDKDKKNKDQDWFIPEDGRKQLTRYFKKLERSLWSWLSSPRRAPTTPTTNT